MKATSQINGFSREDLVARIKVQATWDVIIIGGGATGLGIAVDAASRGYSTLLLEGSDFAKGTSSRSTKLVHGGVRYLAQGNIPLVYSALRERGLLLKNAPHLVKKQSFIIPCYGLADKVQYLAGLKLYDWLSGSLSFGSSRFLSKTEVLQELPGIKKEGLQGGVEYFDGQFDDARLAINLAQTCIEKGGVALNYCKVIRLLKNKRGKIEGVVARENEEGREYNLKAKLVINATGVFVDDIHQMDKPGCKALIKGSQGVHLVFSRSFMPGQKALMIPKTSDGRVLFIIPWQQHLLAGTTDTPVSHHNLEPRPLTEEIQFILQTVRQYFTRPPLEEDILSVFAGLRPLVLPQKEVRNTKEVSRDHKIIVSDTGLLTVIGGKWTTYRMMAEDAIDTGIKKGYLVYKKGGTKELKIHGSSSGAHKNGLALYGSDAEGIAALINERPSLCQSLHPRFLYTEAQVVWAVRNELARTVEDVLARRLRMLFLDASAAIEAAPAVARLMKEEMGYNMEWEKDQLISFTALANQYRINSVATENIFAE